jgi:hypothetical protein
MSQYQCPDCGQSTSVVDTRSFQGKLRRRRKCKNNHQFKTIEIDHKVPDKLDELVNWVLSENTDMDPDLISYFKEQIRNTIYGIDKEE